MNSSFEDVDAFYSFWWVNTLFLQCFHFFRKVFNKYLIDFYKLIDGWENHRSFTEQKEDSFKKSSLVAQRLKHPPAMWETWVRSLGWEDPLEKEMAPHSSILAWIIPWTEEPMWAILHRVAKSRTWLSDFTLRNQFPQNAVLSPV